ncbi:MAG: hypothetical protein K6F00_01270 [Lachnospiraceae bacterium]|nr:hypothetical protein [Lachnospiraceae bacterium]
MKYKKLLMMLLAVALCNSMCFTSMAAGSAKYEKDENIYGILDNNGGVEELYVVNQFEVKKAGEITDYGQFDTVTNLTNTEPINASGEKNTFQAEKGNFYYQGTDNDAALPWDFEIVYYLNGYEIKPDALSGANGDVRIHISSKKNKKANKVFYDNYMLQISMTMDNDKVKNIKAPGATIADAGTSRQINFTVMPGEDADIDLSAKVTDFAMSGISIAGIPFSMDVSEIDTSTMSGDMDELIDGTDELADGTKKLSDGISKLNGNMPKIVKGGKDLTDGSAEIKKGLSQIKKGGKSITDGSGQMKKTLMGLEQKITSMDLSGLSPEDAAYLQQMAVAISSGYSEFDAGVSSYVTGIGTLADNYGEFHSGIKQYSDGMGELSSGINDIADGAKELSNGTRELADGVSTMPEEMDKKVDEMMSEYNKDFEKVSFTDKRNKNINAVQFTLTTPAIERPDHIEEEEKEKEMNFFERLLALFK